MELLREIDTRTSEKLEGNLLHPVTVLVPGLEIGLQSAYQGHDFIFGLWRDSLAIIPTPRISLLRAAMLPPKRPISLLQFLDTQRLPVQLEIDLGGSRRCSWLLSVEDEWLRVSSLQGIEWIPASAILMARIKVVDNSKTA